MKREKKLPILYLGNIVTAFGINPTSVETLGMRLQEEFTVYRASSKRIYFHRLIDMMWQTYRHRNLVSVVLIDTYSTSAFYFSLCCSQLCRFLGIKYIPILRGGELPHRFKRSRFFSKLILMNAYKRVSPSGYLEESAEQLTRVKGEIIPNYIDIKNYPFQLRESMEELNILWVRAFDKIYDPDLAIRIVNQLKNQGIKVKMTMVGGDKDGSYERCQKLVSDLKLTKEINSTGKLTKEEWIKLSVDFNLFLNTTTADNTPVSVMEAMALGFPVVTSSVGGIPYLFNDNVEGLLVKERTIEGFTNAILSLKNDPSRIKNLSQNARNKAETWDWEVVKVKWKNLLSAI